MSALIPIPPSAITTMAADLVNVIRAPSLPLSMSGGPQTLVIFRLMSGASDVDTLLAHMMALPAVSSPAIAHCGGPAGPTFKVHDQAFALRLETDDPDITAKVLDFRIRHGDRHMFATFDPECITSGVQFIEDLASLTVPTRVLFATSRSETTPKFVNRLETSGRKVIRAYRASLRPIESDDDLVYPSISPQWEALYARGTQTLRQIADSSSLGMRISFERNLATMWESIRAKING